MSDTLGDATSGGDFLSDAGGLRRYRLRIGLVLAYLGLFVLVYLGLLGGSAYLLYRSIDLLVLPQGNTVLAWLAIAAAGLLLVALVRPIFRTGRPDQSLLLEIRPESQPTLFGFIRQLCADIGAPLPRKVLLSPDVNAAVVSSTALVNLVVPARQDLVIGLGLVNALNRTEFEAVLAHEFGHFSQKSIRIGPYVYTSARIMADAVHGSRRADYLLRRLVPIAEALLQVGRVDVRLLLFVLPVLLLLYLLIGLMKGFAACLRGLHQLLGLANLALQRHMEFLADRVAVSVAGSDATLNVLVRLPLAEKALGQVTQDLVAAADADLYTRDLFYHQPHAVAFLRKISNDPTLGEPPPLPAGPGPRADFFRPEDTTAARMWATHPSNHEREQNVNRPYVRRPLDEQPAWVLFQDAPALREKLTRRYYQHVLNRALLPTLSAAEIVQGFIDDEHADSAYDPHYKGAYDDRYLDPGNLEQLVDLARFQPWSVEQLARAPTDLFGEDLQAIVARYRGYQQELEALEAADDKAEFEFRGQKYSVGDAPRLQTQVSRDLAGVRLQLAALDRNVFLAHYQMARALGAEAEQELIDRYKFQLGFQGILARVADGRGFVRAALVFLSQREEINQEEFNAVVNGASGMCRTMIEDLEKADGLKLPPLKHVPSDRPLSGLLLGDLTTAAFRMQPDGIKPKRLFRTLLELERAASRVHDRAQRLHYKSLASVLAQHKWIHSRWTAETAGAAVPGEGTAERVESGATVS
jgi:Zn-dependent protease with chaperone function